MTHHPWLLRKAASAAMIAVMSREKFEQDTGATIEDYKTMKDAVFKVKEVMWEFY